MQYLLDGSVVKIIKVESLKALHQIECVTSIKPTFSNSGVSLVLLTLAKQSPKEQLSGSSHVSTTSAFTGLCLSKGVGLAIPFPVTTFCICQIPSQIDKSTQNIKNTIYDSETSV